MSQLIPIEVLGWVAAALTLATFVCRDMLRLRVLALAANMAFIGYGLGIGLWPVVTLHLLLVPINLRRLMELRQARSAGVAGPTVLRQVSRHITQVPLSSLQAPSACANHHTYQE